MNRENVLYCIQLMKQAKNLNMAFWQTRKEGRIEYCNSIEELHSCGNTACFAGYVALSEKFQSDGGEVDLFMDGSPMIETENGWMVNSDDIAFWLGISHNLAQQLVNGDNPPSFGNFFSSFYGKNWMEVISNDVIQKLQEILDGHLK